MHALLHLLCFWPREKEGVSLQLKKKKKIYLLERQMTETRNKDRISHPLVHSLNGNNSQGRAKLKQGAPKPIQVFPCGWVAELQVLGPSSVAFLGVLSQNWIRNRVAGIQTNVPTWDADLLSGSLAHCKTNASPRNRVLLSFALACRDFPKVQSRKQMCLFGLEAKLLSIPPNFSWHPSPSCTHCSRLRREKLIHEKIRAQPRQP